RLRRDVYRDIADHEDGLQALGNLRLVLLVEVDPRLAQVRLGSEVHVVKLDGRDRAFRQVARESLVFRCELPVRKIANGGLRTRDRALRADELAPVRRPFCLTRVWNE